MDFVELSQLSRVPRAKISGEKLVTTRGRGDSPRFTFHPKDHWTLRNPSYFEDPNQTPTNSYMFKKPFPFLRVIGDP